MSGKNAFWTSGLISLSKAGSGCINQKVEEALEPHKNGGVSESGLLSWLYHGSQLEVFSTQSGERLAAWCFGLLLKDPTTTICCCVEFVYGGRRYLVLGTDSVMGNMLLLFDVASSRVTKAIQMPYKVTSICVVSTPSSSEANQAVLGTHLRHLAGMLAVGTHCGHIYLIDMNLEEVAAPTDELSPAVLSYASFHLSDIRKERENALARGRHLCFLLNEDTKRGSFYYRKPDDEVIKSFPADSVIVSCLSWCPRTGQLAVGFSFGSFQLWRLSVPVMEYTGRYEEDLGPVSHFAYQEPENDPRNFCYLWVSRGALPSDHQVDYNSYVTLYQLGFNKKHWHDGSGYMLEDLVSVGPRFEYELTTDPFNSSKNVSCGSRLVSCYTLRDPNFRIPHRIEGEDSFEEGGGSPDLSLCVFVWEAGYADPKPSCYLGVFDMNRWYHAQMPYTVRPTSTVRNLCSYFAFYNLEEVMNSCDPAGLMDLHIPYSSLSKFHSLHIPAPEQHFYPSALSFDACYLAENGLVHCKYLGSQERLLAELQQTGPSLILDPTEYYLRATLAALLPRTADVNTPHSQLHKRESLLSVALEYGRVPFLNACISEFGSGDFTLRGCSLRFFLEWTWKKVGTIKQEVDRLCLSLYDWSGALLDKQRLQILHQHHTVLGRLVQILTALQSQPSTTLGQQDLEVKVHVTNLLTQHLQMVLWLYSAGFLPENSDEESLAVGQYAYPLHTLSEIYRQRRKEVTALHRGLRSCDVLHIDSIVARVGEQLETLLTRDVTSPLYPFPSFHSLLSMFLLEDVSFKAKLTLTFYVLCDLYSLVEEDDQQKFSDKLQQFAQMFSMSVSLQKYVQGIWLLDHKEFKDSLGYLQDPGLHQEVEGWQHTITVKAFLYQGQPRLALRYMRLVKPPLQTPEDIKLRLTVLLANGLTSEAFEYQRLCRDQLNADDLLSHLFVGSLQTKSVDQLLQLPFTEDEEHHLVSYLRTNSSVSSQELLVMYYLQRSRFIEAIRLNAKIRHGAMGGVDESSGTRNCIVEGYQRVLPYVQRKLAFGTDQILQKRTRLRREFTRPTPLSTSVNRCVGGTTVTRATLLQSVLEKTKEVTEDERRTQGSEVTEAGGSRVEEELVEEPGPFVCTPMTDKVRKRVSEAGEVVFSTSLRADLPVASTSVPKVTTSAQNSPFRSFHTTVASPHRTSDTLKSLKKRLTSAADLSLLHTPPIRKKSPPSKRLPCRLDTPKTPQSILKVRHKPLRRSPSPLLFVQRAKSDLVMATPPVPKTRLARMAASQGPSSPVIALTKQESSKKLRFSMPGRGETPTPTEEIDEETPPPSAEKQNLSGDDASPTPRPPIREEMELDESISLESGQDRSREGESPISRQEELRSTEILTTAASELTVDSDISFNFTGTHTSHRQDLACQERTELDLEAMEEECDDYQETTDLEPPKRELSFDLLKHKKIESSMRTYKQVIMSAETSTRSVKMLDSDMESSEEEHKSVQSSEEEHKIREESSEEEHKEEESSEEEHKGAGLYEEAYKESELSEEEHKSVKFSAKQPKGVKFNVVDHKDAELSEENYTGAELNEEHKGAELSEEEHKGAELSEEDYKGEELSEEEHKRAELSQEDHKGAGLSEEEYKGAELSEEEHKGAELSEEEHKGAELSEEEHKEVTFSFSDPRIIETSEGYYKEADFNKAKPKGVMFSETEHVIVESSEEEQEEFEFRPAEQTEMNTLENQQSKSSLLKNTNFSSNSFALKEASCTTEEHKITSFYMEEEHVTLTSSTKMETTNTREISTNKSISDTDASTADEPMGTVCPESSNNEDTLEGSLGASVDAIEKQSVISEDATKEYVVGPSEGSILLTSTVIPKVATNETTGAPKQDKKPDTKDEYAELHLQLDSEEQEIRDQVDSIIQEGETTPKSRFGLKDLAIDLTPVNVVIKEPADSSVDQSNTLHVPAVSVSPSPSERATRSPGRRTPTRRTPTRVIQDEEDLTLTPRRRSMRLASKEKTPDEMQKTPNKTPSKRWGKGENKTPNKPLAPILEQSGEDRVESPSPTRESLSPMRESPSPTRESPSPTRESPSPMRRSPRLTQKHRLNNQQCAVCRESTSFRTPPRPTRLSMPPTPPESSPASTSEEVASRQSPRRGRGRPKKSELTPPRVGRADKVRARSRSDSPPVVTSTTEDLPGEKMEEVSSGPLSNQSFMMSLRTEQPPRDPSPQFSEASNLDDIEFTFAKPEELQIFEARDPADSGDLPGSSFIFSPPMTRQRTRRMSLSLGDTPSSTAAALHSVSILPPLPEAGSELQEATTPRRTSPPRRTHRKAKTPKSGSPLFKPSDIPINFVPEPEEGESGTSTRGMTLRLRNRKSKVPTKRKKPIMW